MLKRAFTLVELLVVISIIALLSSIVFATLSTARVQARDAQRAVEAVEVKKALQAYHLDYSMFPLANTPYEGSRQIEGSLGYTSAMQELVDKGYLPQIPRSPDGSSYAYINFGDDSITGAAFEVTMENPTSVAKVASCIGNGISSLTIAPSNDGYYYEWWVGPVETQHSSYYVIDTYIPATKYWKSYSFVNEYDDQSSNGEWYTNFSSDEDNKPTYCRKRTFENDGPWSPPSQVPVACPDLEPTIAFLNEIGTTNSCVGTGVACACPL